MPREFSRGRRIADHIQKELAVLIQQEIQDPRVGLVTINEVKVSRDLAFADVYFTSFASDVFSRKEGAEQDPDDGSNCTEVLEHAAGFLRSRLSKTLSTRTTPKLRFHYDHTIEQGAKMTQVIKQAIESDEQLKVANSLIDERDGNND